MLIYLGFDDTDDHDSPIGTGRLVREFAKLLPEGYALRGIVRHQLPRLRDIPFTSNNSSACALIDMSADLSTDPLLELAASHLTTHCAPGSDPGLCMAREDAVTPGMVEFGKQATAAKLTQGEAIDLALPIELLGLGGTNDGIIGALAAVGLTRFGWCGRFIEYGKLRDLPDAMTVGDLFAAGIDVVSVDRDPLVPRPGDAVENAAWIRPSLWGGKPVLQVRAAGFGVWEPAHGKRPKAGHGQGARKRAATAPGIA
ncbi:hypothetical protein LF599_14435 [Pseudodesulfovibrio thermohalotolerans]|uniref:hypothetical protein n=1 Tax=Pseudodesulfovibrio thermohalotolerans TaxID=2880651 RepID=UPI002442C34C|nr:hypothetical protein [Pseudodesulfovibrio thermohalotolerans]WFS61857.1 hypothetical protein LF599_14435 [Pseudodesulfovibrio thermohalotolerans]